MKISKNEKTLLENLKNPSKNGFKINPNKPSNHHGIKPLRRHHLGDNPHNHHNGPHFQTPSSDI